MSLVLLPEMILYKQLLDNDKVTLSDIIDFKSKLIVKLGEKPPFSSSSCVITDGVTKERLLRFCLENEDVISSSSSNDIPNLSLMIKEGGYVENKVRIRYNRALNSIYDGAAREMLENTVNDLLTLAQAEHAA